MIAKRNNNNKKYFKLTVFIFVYLFSNSFIHYSHIGSIDNKIYSCKNADN